MTHSPAFATACDDAGRTLSPSLDGAAAVIIAARDVEAAAHVALGVAAAQAERRRVAVADLAGTAMPLRRLVGDDDPHGLADVFDFGISLNRVARQVDDDGRLFVIPAGLDAVLRPDLMDDERWGRLREDFRDVGALLLLVAPSDAPGLDRLAGAVDGVVAADDAPATLALPHRIARADIGQALQMEFPPPRTREFPDAAPSDAGAAFDRAAAESLATAPALATPAPVTPAHVGGNGAAHARNAGRTNGTSGNGAASPNGGAPPGSRLHPALAAIIGLMSIILLVLLVRGMSGGGDDRLLASGDSVSRAGSVARDPAESATPLALAPAAGASVAAGEDAAPVGPPAGAARDPIAPDPIPAGGAASPAARATSAPPRNGTPLPVANASDTARASAYAVVLGTYTTEQAAQRHFRDRPRYAAAVTIVHAQGDGGAPLFHVVTGASQRRQVAEGIRSDYRARGALRDTSAGVVRLPYAVQVESGVPIGRDLDSLVSVLNRFLARGFPAYALEQPRGGRANVYVGAFAEPDDARALIARLQAAGLPAALVVRQGRAL